MSSPFQAHTYPIRKVDAARQEPPATPEGSAAAGASEDVAAADTAGSPSGAPETPAPHETAGFHETPGASGGGAHSWGVQPGLATPAGGADAAPQPGGADVSVPSAQAPVPPGGANVPAPSGGANVPGQSGGAGTHGTPGTQQPSLGLPAALGSPAPVAPPAPAGTPPLVGSPAAPVGSPAALGAPDATSPLGPPVPGAGGNIAGWFRRHRLILGIGAAAIVVLTFVVPVVASTGRLPFGVRVAGVDIGGLPPAQAEATLRRELADEAARPIQVTAGKLSTSIDPAEVGLKLDARATVAAADDGFPSPVDLFTSLFGERDVAPRIQVDERKLAAAIEKIAADVDRPKRDGAVRYRGVEPVAVTPKPGRVIDRKAAAAAVRGAFLRTAAPTALPFRTDTPTVSAAQVQEAARTTARAAVAKPVTLTNGSRRATISRQALASGLRWVADGKGGLRPQVKAKTMIEGLERRLIPQAEAPQDATFEIEDGKPRLVESRPGQGVDTTALSSSLAKVVSDANAGREIPIQVKTAEPRVTTEEARGYGIKEMISTFTTRHPCCAPRVTNIHKIADILDGYIVKPGETFSLNNVVGERDRARGFVPAPQILRGRFVNDVGGGISQFVTTMFNAVFFGGLQDVQHTPHQFYISRYPAGRESTVSYPQPDFRWKNDSPYGVLVKTSYTDTSITVSFWSTKRYDIESKSSKPYDRRPFETTTDSGKGCIPMPGAEGFSIDVWRIFKRDGVTVRTEKFHTVYQPEPKLTCKKKESD